MYTKITISKVKKRGKFDSENLIYRVTENHTHADTTGLGGTWQGSGSLMDIYLCDGYLVGISPFNHRPILVVKTLPDLVEALESKTKCQNIEMNT